MKTKFVLSEWLIFVPAVLLMMLWSYAAVSKIADYGKFVAQMQLAPIPLMILLGPILGWLIPAIELILVGMLITEKSRRAGLIFSFLLLLTFEVYIAVMLLSGLDLPCTCGGLISSLQWKEHLIFNAVFMFISIFPFISSGFRNRNNNSNRYSPRSIYN